MTILGSFVVLLLSFILIVDFFTYSISFYYIMEVFQMTINDDLKAINKDIEEAKYWEQLVQRTKYWLVRLKNIYPDYEFKTYFKPLRDKNIIFIDYKVKGVI